jgi:branched-chain amino acid transport system substrate-binding protein
MMVTSAGEAAVRGASHVSMRAGRGFLLASVALAATLLVAACQPLPRPTGAAPTPGTAAGDGATASSPFGQRHRPGSSGAVATARIGVALSLTGAGAPIGVMQEHAVRLAVDEINSSRLLGNARLEPIYGDDASDKTTASELFRTFVANDHVVAILGPTLTSVAYAADPIAQQAGVPVLGLSNAAGAITDVGEFVFRCSVNESQIVPPTVQAVKARLHVRRAALLFGDDAATRLTMEGFKRSLGDGHVHVVAEQSFPPGQADIAEQLAVIRDSHPDVLFVAASVADAPAIVTRVRGAGLGLPMVGGNAFNSAVLRSMTADAAEGVIVGGGWSAASDDPRSRAFVASFRSRWDQDPDQFAAQAYAGVYIMAAGLRNAHTLTDARALRDGLAAVRDLDTVLGRFSFTDDRNADAPVVVQIVKNGKLVPLGSDSAVVGG